ncbi:MAG: protein-L-isoaspartate O-methyltransferase family protein [Geminicoccaceae bacterium]
MDYAQARAAMVDSQLRTNRIDDPAVLSAMAAIPRERFLPKSLHGVAYADEDLPLTGGRFLIEPLALARLLQAAVIKPDDVVLVVGCGTGYAAAVASKLAATVISMSTDQQMVDGIQPVLDGLEADNVVTAIDANPIAGDPGQAPFDVILVIGAIAEMPKVLVDQLGEGGRLAAIIGAERVGKGVVATKIDDVTAERILFDARIPALAGLEKTQEFAF